MSTFSACLKDNVGENITDSQTIKLNKTMLCTDWWYKCTGNCIQQLLVITIVKLIIMHGE